MRSPWVVPFAALGVVLGCEPSGQESRQNGEACSWSLECTGGICLSDADGFAGGLCTEPCPDRTCGERFVCVDMAVGGLCLPRCGAGCREGYVCRAEIDACLPDCRLGFACGGGWQCGVDGACRVASPDLLPAGAACELDAACAGGICLPAAGDAGAPGWPDGMCTAFCNSGQCPAGAACAPVGDGRYCLPSCGAPVECRDGYLCSASLDVCLPDCRVGWPCGAGWVCGAAGECEPDWPDLGDVGAPCGGPADCDGGICFSAEDDGAPTGWSGGACSAPCVDGACPDGAVCVPLDGELWCLPACESSAGCRDDHYACDEHLGACLPHCGEPGWDCGDGFVCKPDGRCGLPTPMLGELGDPCESAAGCSSGICFEETDAAGGPTGFTGGMCADLCAGGACPEGSGCILLDAQTWCLPECGAGCRAGYVCTEGLCLPDCHAPGWDCGEKYVCSAGGECVPPPAQLADVGAPCKSDIGCASGICFEEKDAAGPTGWIGGTCSDVCPGGACGPGEACTVLDGELWCLSACVSTAGCRPGYVCSDDLQVCLPNCNLGWDCGDKFACEADGQCQPDYPELAPIGAPCIAPPQCGTSFCVPPVKDGQPTGWVGGMCSLACPLGAGCPPGTKCAPMPGLPPLCLPDCSSNPAICRDGYICHLGQGICMPNCNNVGFPCPECTPSGQCKGGPGPGPGPGA